MPTVDRYKSPLRYPGGKSRAAKEFAQILAGACASVTRPVASPFFGGGSVELRLAELGYTVLGTDAFYPVARFWQALKHVPEDLHAGASEFLPGLTKEEFKLLQEELRHLNDTQGDPLRTATLFFVLNRCSFSGTTLSGGMSPGCARFTQSAVDRLLQVDTSNIEVRHGDYWTHLLDPALGIPWAAIYADPPYCLESGKNKLYGDKGSTHDSFDHELFAARILSLNGSGIATAVEEPEAQGALDVVGGRADSGGFIWAATDSLRHK
jgi:DNA adenine methylase